MSVQRGTVLIGNPCAVCGSVERSARTGKCMECNRRRARKNIERKRAELGDEAFRALRAETHHRRRADPAKRQQDYVRIKARSRALERLATEHPKDFARLVDAERAGLGLPPIGTLQRRAAL